MTGNSRRNVLVMQSGGCTPVLNRSLFGVVQQTADSNSFGKIYGAMHGMEGVLAGDLADLGKVSKAEWSRIARTPAAALGSTRRKLRPEDVPVILETLASHDIGYWFIIGGNDSAETGHAIGVEARKAGYDLAIMNVPKTIDNDLVLTDHCPGYGSAARFVVLATMGAGRDAESMGQASPITIIEVMGRDAGWLAASSGLAKQDERDAPHFIGVPEILVDENRFLTRIEEAYRKYGFAVAVIAENTRGPDGVIGGHDEPWYVDDFGHAYYDGPSRYLAGLVARHLNVRTRYEKPGTIQRALEACVSKSDAQEAEMAGRAAVRYALEGHADEIVTLQRVPGEKYACTTGVAPLEKVGGKVKEMPDEYLDEANNFVTPAFIDYVKPLVGARLPKFGRVR